MPKRISKPSDLNQAAFLMVQRSIGSESPAPRSKKKRVNPLVSEVMRAMGRKGGQIGGKRRLETMTPERRSEIAMKAAQSRWAKKKK